MRHGRISKKRMAQVKAYGDVVLSMYDKMSTEEIILVTVAALDATFSGKYVNAGWVLREMRKIWKTCAEMDG